MSSQRCLLPTPLLYTHIAEPAGALVWGARGLQGGPQSGYPSAPNAQYWKGSPLPLACRQGGQGFPISGRPSPKGA